MSSISSLYNTCCLLRMTVRSLMAHENVCFAAAFFCAHYIIIFSFHSYTHEPVLTHSFVLLRMTVRSLMAHERNVCFAAAFFLLRSLYYYQFCLSSKSSSVGSSGSSRNTVLIYLFISVRISLLLPSSGHIRLCVTHIRCTPCFLASSSKVRDSLT